MASIERRHANHWADKLRAAGVDVPASGRAGLRIRLIGAAARWLSVSAVLPLVERGELVLLYRAKGLNRADAERLADRIMADPEVALDTLACEELGLDPDKLGSPWSAAFSSLLVLFTVGAGLGVLNGRSALRSGIVPACLTCDAHGMRPTLFEFAGGEPAFLALAAAHHARCLQDPELNHPFSHPGQHPEHVARLAAYWAEVMGGPPRYSQSCGDHSAMLHMHSGEGDMTELGRRFIDCFVRAADDAGLPDDPEFRAALRSYMQWAVDDVLAYPSPDVEVPAGLPMPRWSWDGLQLRAC